MGSKCPICNTRAGHGTFLCRGCSFWIHPKCGGYTKAAVQEAGSEGTDHLLRCNNCAKVSSSCSYISFSTNFFVNFSLVEIEIHHGLNQNMKFTALTKCTVDITPKNLPKKLPCNFSARSTIQIELENLNGLLQSNSFQPMQPPFTLAAFNNVNKETEVIEKEKVEQNISIQSMKSSREMNTYVLVLNSNQNKF